MLAAQGAVMAAMWGPAHSSLRTQVNVASRCPPWFIPNLMWQRMSRAAASLRLERNSSYSMGVKELHPASAL